MGIMMKMKEFRERLDKHMELKREKDLKKLRKQKELLSEEVEVQKLKMELDKNNPWRK